MNWLEVTLVGFLAGAVGTGLGGSLGTVFRRPSQRLLGFLLGIAAGLMLAIVFMELLEEAIAESFYYGMAGLLLGIGAFIILDRLIPHRHPFTEEQSSPVLLRKGTLIALGIALHNLPEGIAIGAGFAASTSTGVALAVIIALHNIPEGMAISVPLTAGQMSRRKAVAFSIAAGLPVGLGALLGSTLSEISPLFLSAALGFAAGAMLYIVCDELIPDVYSMSDPHTAIWGITSGTVLGVALIHFL